jgi:hypothetical protein
MLPRRPNQEKLFTFGDGELQEFLSQERKSKFPFLQSAKLKKTPLLRKLISEQRDREGCHPETSDCNTADTIRNFRIRERAMSHQEQKKYTLSLGK